MRSERLKGRSHISLLNRHAETSDEFINLTFGCTHGYLLTLSIPTLSIRQFPFGQLPILSIPTLSIPIWSMLTKWELTKWELTKWELTKLEVDKVGIDKVGKIWCCLYELERWTHINIYIQWNPSITDNIGNQNSVSYSEVFLTQELPAYFW